MEGKAGILAHPVIDFGGTHCRVGWVARRVVNGRFSGMPRLISSAKFACPLNAIGEPDVAKTLAQAKGAIIGSSPKGTNILQTVGGSFPGAWLESGYAYKGTPNNTRELENFQLPMELATLMGAGWKAYINNDGVSHVLAIAQGLIADLNKFPRILETLGKAGNVVGFIPGTGFGAGAFKYTEGHLVPIPGPQQFFDVVIGEGEGILDPKRINPEDLASGVGFAFQAKKTLLLYRYTVDALSTQNVGKLLSRLAFSKAKGIPDEERETALSLYKQAAKALVDTMLITYRGGVEGRIRKMVVNDPPELEAQFWKAIKGTQVFILGGWLTSKDVKAFMGHAIWTELVRADTKRLSFIFADDIPGVSRMIKSDAVALIGAALLVPDAEDLGS